MNRPPCTPPSYSQRPPTISLGNLDLTGLDLINLDLDELTDIANSQSNNKALSPDDAFSKAKKTMAKNSTKGQRLYTESITSEDGSSSSRKSSAASITSNSSFSSNCSSNYSNRSTSSNISKRDGKRLVALGLAASEVVELSTAKKKAKKEQKKQLLHHRQQQRKSNRMTEKQAVAQIQKEFLQSFHETEIVYEPLTEIQMARMVTNFPRLSTFAASNLSSLFDRMTNKHAQLICKQSRRFEYEFRARSLGGKRRDKKTNERVPVLLGEFISKYIFMPKTRHLLKNGDLLFLQLFNMFMEKNWNGMKKLYKKNGCEKFREKITTLEGKEDMISFYKKAVKGNCGYWLNGVQIDFGKKNKLLYTPKRKKTKKGKKEMSSRRRSSMMPTDGEEKQQQQKRNFLFNPDLYDEYVDESGETIWTDHASGRIIKSSDLREPEKFAKEIDPFDGWSKIIDGYGQSYYIHPETGESVKATKDTTKTIKKNSKKNSKRKSLVGRGIHKIGKWFSKKSSSNKDVMSHVIKNNNTNQGARNNLGLDNV